MKVVRVFERADTLLQEMRPYTPGRAAIEARDSSAKSHVKLDKWDRAKRGMGDFDGFAVLLTILIAASNALRAFCYLTRQRDGDRILNPPRGRHSRKNTADENIIGKAWGSVPLDSQENAARRPGESASSIFCAPSIPVENDLKMKKERFEGNKASALEPSEVENSRAEVYLGDS